MFKVNPFIQMVRFVLCLARDRDEDPGFRLINIGCVELLAIHDCTYDLFYSDGCIHTVDPYT